MARAKKVQNQNQDEAIDSLTEGEEVSEEVSEETITVVKPVKEPTPPARLCKGNMPSPLVWFIRFKEDHTNITAIAKKYFTTPGKITDIVKSMGQKYITEDTVFNAEELKAAHETILANFVRGQGGEDLGKRKTATTIPGDEEYSLSVLANEENWPTEGVSLAEARGLYLVENPRAVRVKTAKAELEEEVEENDEVEEDDIDSMTE